jgi:hypothetical protein
LNDGRSLIFFYKRNAHVPVLLGVRHQ